MPIITQSFKCKNGDPFSNLTLEVTDDKVLINVHCYAESVPIALSRDEAYRLAKVIVTELGITEQS